MKIRDQVGSPPPKPFPKDTQNLYNVVKYYCTTISMSTASITKVTRKYQITVPKEVRESLSIQEGDYLAVITNGDELIVKKLELPEWDEIFEKGEKSAKEKGLTKEDIIEAVREERRAE